MASSRVHRPDLTGQRFGRLTVLREVSPYRHPDGKGSERRWLCRCDCGGETVATTSGLRRGEPRSCGCLFREVQSRVHRTHGQFGTPTYRSYRSMLARCLDPNYIEPQYYAEKGITVCERWRGFENFLADMGERPSSNHSIDRIDPGKGYEPGNCRWATSGEQRRNCSHTRWLTFQGRTLCLADWAAELGIRRQTLEARLKRGWSVEDALTRPVK